MKCDRTSPYKEDDVLATLRGIRSTDPRFAWLTRKFGEEPDRRRDLATMIEDQFADEPDGDLQQASLLAHLGAMIADMRTLNPVEELFDIVVPCVPAPHRLSVLLRRMGWSGEHWYTEYEATFALGTSIHGVRNERAKLVRALRRGPVWTPILHRCAALIQQLAPMTQSQFHVACGIDLEGKDSMTLWGFLNALDQFDIEHWFHLEHANREPVLYCDLHVDFGYERQYLDGLVVDAERRIAREIARRRRERNRERLERLRYEDPWEVRPSTRSRMTDVGFSDASPILWRDIPENCALRAEPGYDDLQYGAPLIMRRMLITHEKSVDATFVAVPKRDSVPNPSHLDAYDSSPMSKESAPSAPTPEPKDTQLSEAEHNAAAPNPADNHLELELDACGELDSAGTLSPKYVDLAVHVPQGLVGHVAGPIDEAVVASMESIGQRWAPIIDCNSGRCIGAVRTSRLRNKLNSGVPEIGANDGKLQGVELDRIARLRDVLGALRKKKVVYYNGAPGSWGAVFQKEK